MIFEVICLIHCDKCSKKVPCTMPFELGGPLNKQLTIKYPDPEEGRAFNGKNGAEYLCANCDTEKP